MSWDLFVADIPESMRTIDDVPKDWEPPVIGTPTQIIVRVLQAFPDADFSEPDVGHIAGEGYSVEMYMSRAEKSITTFMLAVRGDERAAYAAAELVTALGLRAFDTGSADGTIFPGEDVTGGWRAWAEFRNRVIGDQ